MDIALKKQKKKTKERKEKKKTDLRFPKGKREGCIGNLALAYGRHYIQNGQTTRIYCVAQGTIFDIL